MGRPNAPASWLEPDEARARVDELQERHDEAAVLLRRCVELLDANGLAEMQLIEDVREWAADG